MSLLNNVRKAFRVVTMNVLWRYVFVNAISFSHELLQRSISYRPHGPCERLIFFSIRTLVDHDLGLDKNWRLRLSEIFKKLWSCISKESSTLLKGKICSDAQKYTVWIFDVHLLSDRSLAQT